MTIKNTNERWGNIAIGFHWLIALLIFLAMVLGWVAVSWPVSPLKLDLFVWHKTLGISILFLAILRLLWKLMNPAPGPAEGITKRNAMLATLGHWVLYFMMIAMPLSGWILNSAANFPFKWFGLFPVPMITETNDLLQHRAELVHLVLFWLLLSTVIGHAIMAVLHHLKHESTILTRMIPAPFTVKGFLIDSLLIIAVACLALAIFIPLTTDSRQQVKESFEQKLIQKDVTTPAENGWQVLYEKSKLGFKGLYAGVEFDGEFKQFSAKINFDPEAPDSGHFEVSIDTRSITTFSEERDMMIGDADWFYFKMYPASKFTSKSIVARTKNSYSAIGVLDLKGRQKEVELRFTWESLSGGETHVYGEARMLAEADIKRGDFGIGEGDWAKDETVGFDVLVKVDLLLQPIH